ncbi:Sphingosine N-acyltransferase lag1 [Vermiconidia calcicola]|uniref:Sphingosine N-acyltransferase lag1 n=1 Tax=Vermiconidia calcicola TaxID=1690605 RepID=A0ACC3NIG1_9PEZI|nr:Sphingosine N-acyltransferase lag1 [Vermiconidia calcicola]
MATHVPVPMPNEAAIEYPIHESTSSSDIEIGQPYTPPSEETDSPPLGDTDSDEREINDMAFIRSKGHENGNFDAKARTSFGGVDVDELGICASPAYTAYTSSTRSKRKGNRNRNRTGSTTGSESLAGMIRKGVVEHQLGLSLNLILLVFMSWSLFPSLRERLDALFMLSYRTEQQAGMFGQGPRDLWLVAAFIVFFTGVRAFMLDYVLIPLAGRLGVMKSKARVRFAEQGYLLLYYLMFWNFGLYLFIRDTPGSLPSPNISNSTQTHSSLSNLLISMWTQFPRLYLDAGMKVYYLSQLAFWIQQIIVVHLEEKRKDHYQMLTHHLVTVALMSTSYGYRQWRVGNAVLVCMDIVEIIFPSAKILKYIGWQRACDAAFALFVVVWLLARHAAYLTICWSIYAHVNEVVMPYGTYSLTQTASSAHGPGQSLTGVRLSPSGDDKALQHIYQPFLNPAAETVSFNARIRWRFLGMLLGLQCITLLWFCMIVRVVLKVLRGEGADDTRSDDEDGCDGEPFEDDDEEEVGPAQPSAPSIAAAEEKPRFIEVESSSKSFISRSSSGSRGSRPKSKGGGTFSSGLNLGDRKDILNRIGCLSEEQLAREREKKR